MSGNAIETIAETLKELEDTTLSFEDQAKVIWFDLFKAAGWPTDGIVIGMPGTLGRLDMPQLGRNYHDPECPGRGFHVQEQESPHRQTVMREITLTSDGKRMSRFWPLYRILTVEDN